MSMSPLAEAVMEAERNRHPLKGVPAAKRAPDEKYLYALPWNKIGKLKLFMCQSVLDQLSDYKRANYRRKHGREI